MKDESLPFRLFISLVLIFGGIFAYIGAHFFNVWRIEKANAYLTPAALDTHVALGDKSVDLWKRAALLWPENRKLPIQIADALYAGSSYEDAINWYEMAPESEYALGRVTSSYLRLGRVEAAEKNLKLLIEKFPSLDTYILAAKFHNEQGMLKEAGEDLKQAKSYGLLNQEPEMWQTIFGAGKDPKASLEQANNLSIPQADFLKKSLKNITGSADPVYRQLEYGKLYRHYELPTSAGKALAAAEKIDADSKEVRLFKAELMVENGSYKNAYEELLKLASFDPTDPRILKLTQTVETKLSVQDSKNKLRLDDILAL